ncbi:MAG: methyltransferase RsmF C-terminal domain-like protein [Candidatus Methanodesulfokora sp.]|jgi:NOL1/NOP2/fmu family ribosome biogenesis protein
MIEEFISWFKDRFGGDISHLKEFFVVSGEKRIRMVSPESKGINGIIKGIYIAKKVPFGFSLSIEGSQILGKYARRNVVSLDKETALVWMKGEDIPLEGHAVDKGTVIIKYKWILMGSGYFDGQRVRNYVPGERRLE